MSLLAFLDIGFSEMLVVAFVALVLFGGRLPEVMRTLGMSYRKFRKGMDDVTRQVTRPDLGLNLKDLTDPYRPIPPASTTIPPGARPSPPSPPTSWTPAAVPPTAVAVAVAVPAPEAVGAAPAAPSAPPAPTALPPSPLPEAPRIRVDDDAPDV